MFEVSSEIYKETNFQSEKSGAADGKVVSKFRFSYPEEELFKARTLVDKDGDLVVSRRKPETLNKTESVIEIEHSEATVLKLVGLQVWRGALLLADYFFYKREDFQDKQVLELGAGVGLTSIAAAIYARKVICTDVDIGGILNLIRANVHRNRNLCSDIQVMEYDFKLEPENYSEELKQAINDSDIVIAADIIYDDDLTNAFIRVIDQIFESEKQIQRKKEVYVALEKRFVFTFSELDAVAPMFEYFIKQTMKKTWRFEYIPLNFPQYFVYERCKQLVLQKLTSS